MSDKGEEKECSNSRGLGLRNMLMRAVERAVKNREDKLVRGGVSLTEKQLNPVLQNVSVPFLRSSIAICLVRPGQNPTASETRPLQYVSSRLHRLQVSKTHVFRISHRRLLVAGIRERFKSVVSFPFAQLFPLGSEELGTQDKHI